MNETKSINCINRHAMWLFLVMIMTSPLKLSAQQQEKSKDQITALELYDAFKKDAEAATTQYAKKTLKISGIAVYVGPDVYTLPSVELSGKKGEKGKILCVLPFSDYLKLRKVSKGNEMLIKGEIRGYSEKHDVVVVKECEIIENKK